MIPFFIVNVCVRAHTHTHTHISRSIWGLVCREILKFVRAAMCKGSEEHCSKTQNADPEDKEMKNRDLGYHGWFVWVHIRWRFTVQYSLTTLRTGGLLDWTWSLSCQRVNSFYVWLFYGYFLKRVAENECIRRSAAPYTMHINYVTYRYLLKTQVCSCQS